MVLCTPVMDRLSFLNNVPASLQNEQYILFCCVSNFNHKNSLPIGVAFSCMGRDSTGTLLNICSELFGAYFHFTWKVGFSGKKLGNFSNISRAFPYHLCTPEEQNDWAEILHLGNCQDCHLLTTKCVLEKHRQEHTYEDAPNHTLKVIGVNWKKLAYY